MSTVRVYFDKFRVNLMIWNNRGKQNRHIWKTKKKKTKKKRTLRSYVWYRAALGSVAQNKGCGGVIAWLRLWTARRWKRAARSPTSGRPCTTRWCTVRTAYPRNGPTRGVAATCSWTRTFCRTRRTRIAGGPRRGLTARVALARVSIWKKNVRWTWRQ